MSVLHDAGQNALVTRVSPEVARELRSRLPGLVYQPEGRLLALRVSAAVVKGRGTIAVWS